MKHILTCAALIALCATVAAEYPAKVKPSLPEWQQCYAQVIDVEYGRYRVGGTIIPGRNIVWLEVWGIWTGREYVYSYHYTVYSPAEWQDACRGGYAIGRVSMRVWAASPVDMPELSTVAIPFAGDALSVGPTRYYEAMRESRGHNRRDYTKQ